MRRCGLGVYGSRGVVAFRRFFQPFRSCCLAAAANPTAMRALCFSSR